MTETSINLLSLLFSLVSVFFTAHGKPFKFASPEEKHRILTDTADRMEENRQKGDELYELNIDTM